LPLGHFRAAGNVLRLGAPVELLLGGRPIARPGAGGLASACGRLPGVLSAHGAAAFAASARADVRLALTFLLSGFAARLLVFGLGEIASVLALAFIFRCTGFLERDGDGLAAALDLAGLAAGPALQFAMLELVHD